MYTAVREARVGQKLKNIETWYGTRVMKRQIAGVFEKI